MKPTAQDLKTLQDVAQKLRVDPLWLMAVINFETAGTWDPKIKNPLSSAMGLIQFTNATAISLGYPSAAALVNQFPTISSQLKGPVHAYFSKFAPFKTEQDFYFSVFLPIYRKSPLDTVIFHDRPTSQPAFRKANPGIVTVGDYYTKLKKAFSKFHPTPASSAASGGTLVVLMILGVTLYLTRR